MGRVYSAEMDGIDTTLLGPTRFLAAIMIEGTNKPTLLKLLKIHIASDSVDTNEQLSIDVERVAVFTVGTSAWTQPLENPYDAGDAAAVANARMACTSETGMTLTREADALISGGAASLTGFNFEARQGKEPVVKGTDATVDAAAGWAIRLADAPATATALRCEVTWEEMG